MEQRKAPSQGVAGGETQGVRHSEPRLATKRELSLLEQWFNFKHGNPTVVPGVAYWAKQELNKSLKAA